MSIDAVVVGMVTLADGSQRLTLEQPDRSRTAGQSTLTVIDAPSNLAILLGGEIWGGDSFLMCGQIEIGKREGYTTCRMDYDKLIEVASHGPLPVIEPRELIGYNRRST